MQALIQIAAQVTGFFQFVAAACLFFGLFVALHTLIPPIAVVAGERFGLVEFQRKMSASYWVRVLLLLVPWFSTAAV